MHFGDLIASFTCQTCDNCSPITVTRYMLHQQLMIRAKELGVIINTGFKVVNIIENIDDVIICSENNEQVVGKIVVGADGVGSYIRKLLNPNTANISSKVYAGYFGIGILTRNESKIEMELYQYSNHRVGIASIGRINTNYDFNSVFLWTHIHIQEDIIADMSYDTVSQVLDERAKEWCEDLKCIYNVYKNDSERTLIYAPVYNGKSPEIWYNNRYILLGDAAHPYGPGGQGISMALKDACAVSDIITNDFTDEKKKKEYQCFRGKESQLLGESAEKRNQMETNYSSVDITIQGYKMKLAQCLLCGQINM